MLTPIIAQQVGNFSIPQILGFVAVGLLVIFAIVLLAFMGQFFKLWLRALLADAHVNMLDLVGMRLRRVDPNVIVNARIQSVKAGLNVSTNELETHYLANGRVPNVVVALIAAEKAKLELTWDEAAAIDLAGRDIVDAVNTSVNPKVIDCPNASSGRATIDGVAQDGIQLRTKAKVTVRTNLEKLIKGATEETIIARVGEGIVTAIGSAASYKDVLENPNKISHTVLNKGLHEGTAFEILSIDIAEVDVGDNVGAKLQADQAEADMRRFRAEAEKRRALAVAQEQEYVAEAQKNRALVVLAEAEVPRAMAEAFRNGNLGVMDYYKMKNILADTQMRSSIAGDSPTAPPAPGNPPPQNR